MTAAQHGLFGAEYQTILADPPWREQGAGRIKRGADRHYRLLLTKEIPGVMQASPLWRPAADCHLWLWVTNNHLPDGLWVMAELGFRYVNKVTWAKHSLTSKLCVLRGDDRCSGCPSGLGRYFCGQTEDLLFGVRGRAMVPEPPMRRSTLLSAPRRAHSEKPLAAYGVIESISPAPRCELFQRGWSRAGWDGWGNEAPELLAAVG